MQKFKKFIFPGITLTVSVYFSILFAIGIIIGYISTRYCHRKITKDWGWQSVKINLGKRKLHFHHWLMGTVAMVLIGLFGGFGIVPNFVLGMFGGFIAQGVYDYGDWHQIIIQK